MRNILTAALSILIFQLTAQDIQPGKLKPNNIQIEGLGQGFGYSLKYERVLINNSRFKTLASAGGSLYSFDGPTGTLVFEINELLSFNKHHIETGIGHTFWHSTGLAGDQVVRGWDPFLTGRIGYRYQEPDGKFLFRIGFMPVLTYVGGLEYYYSWYTLSFGYCF